MDIDQLLSNLGSLNMSTTTTQQLCDQPITHSELRQYLLSGPTKFALFQYSPPNPTSATFSAINLFNISFSDPVTWSADIVEVGHDLDQLNFFWGSTADILSLNSIILRYTDYLFTSYLDILTTYRILSQRRQCLNIPSYAKIGTAQQFRSIVNKLNTNNIEDILDLYIYLVANAWVLGIPLPLVNSFKIPINNRLPVFNSTNSNPFSLITQNIPILINLISQQINSL